MTQSTINIESDAGKHLRLMATGAGWIDTYDRAAAEWLVKHGYARWSGQALYMTIPHYDAENNRMPGPETGLERYEALCRNPSVTASPAAWKEEARSGLAVGSGKLGTVTTQSGITRAVIPSPSPPRTPRSPEDVASANEGMAAARRKWLRMFECTEDELYRYGCEGRIKWCKGCDDWGIFDLHSRDGAQSRCRKCRKDGRS